METATWAGVIAALLLGLLALFKEPIQSWFFHPSFRVTTKSEPPDCVSVPAENPNGERADSIYLRVLVENVGRRTARNVEVYGEGLARVQADGRPQRVPEFPPMNLVWSNFPLGMYLPRLAPGMRKHCDIGHIIEPAKRSVMGEENVRLGLKPDETSLAFDLVAKLNNQHHIVRPGMYQLDIVVAADNARPLQRRVEINVTGKWYPEEARMLSDGVGIRVL